MRRLLTSAVMVRPPWPCRRSPVAGAAAGEVIWSWRAMVIDSTTGNVDSEISAGSTPTEDAIK